MTLSSSTAEAALKRVFANRGRLMGGLGWLQRGALALAGPTRRVRANAERLGRIIARRRAWTAPCLVLAIALSACPAPTFREHGPRELDAGGGGESAPERRAWDLPYLVAAPADVLAGRPARYRVIDHMQRDSLWVLVLGPEAGEAIELSYRVADGLRLPIEPGELLWFNQSSDGVGLVVRDEALALRVLIVVDGVLADAVEGAIVPSFDIDRLMYTEVVALPSGCMLVLDHHALEVQQRGQRTFVGPGSRTRVTLASSAGDLTADLYAFDASRPALRRQDRQSEDDPRCPALAHVSWMLVRTP